MRPQRTSVEWKCNFPDGPGSGDLQAALDPATPPSSSRGSSPEHKRLQRAWRRIELLREEIREYDWRTLVTSDMLELRNLADVAALIIRSAQLGKESRGLHDTLDHPERSDTIADTVLVRGEPKPEAWPRAPGD